MAYSERPRWWEAGGRVREGSSEKSPPRGGAGPGVECLGEHKHNRPIGTLHDRRRKGRAVHHCWEKEGEGLAGARLCDADHVTRCHHDRPNTALDRRGLCKLGARLERFLAEACIRKGGARPKVAGAILTAQRNAMLLEEGCCGVLVHHSDGAHRPGACCGRGARSTLLLGLCRLSIWSHLVAL